MSALTSLAERLTAKTWTPEIVESYLGPLQRCAVTHAADEAGRAKAASGGAVSALLIRALATGAADAALVTRTVVEDGRVRARYEIATTADEVLAAQGSTYVLGDFVRDAIPLIAQYPGKVAVVCLPCEATAIARRANLAEKVAFVIALFCGHASRPELVDQVVERLSADVDSPLSAFRFRSGHWRGVLTATFADGTVVERPFSTFGTYQNLYYASAKKCMFCGDHFGYNADLCAGDLWSSRYANDPVKHTAVVAKTERGESVLADAEASGALVAETVEPEVILEGQRRVAPFHYNTSARARAAARKGMRIPDPGYKVAWHEALAARIVIGNYLATLTEEDLRAVLARPAWRHKLMLYVLKGLESLS